MVVVLMGVSGSGKTTVGKLLAASLQCSFADADDYHSPAHIAKMRGGTPLTDADRAPWLQALRGLIERQIADDCSLVLACSALKNSYRDVLNAGPQVVFVYLKVAPRVLRRRLLKRKDHYMTAAMLDSQLDTLEEPADAITVDGGVSSAAVVAKICERLHSGVRL